MSMKSSTGKPAPSLEELIRLRFSAEGKAERVSRALRALDEEVPMKLTPGQWKWVADDPDADDQA